MSFSSFLGKKEPLLSFDIGSTSIKCVELQLKSSKPALLNVAMAPLTPDVFSGYTISNPEKVADRIKNILDANSITAKRVVAAMAAPAVFSKKISVNSMDSSDLRAYMELEASNIVPHSIDAVRMDYHVVGESEDGQMEVLVVAVKNELVDSYLETFGLCDMQVAVIDVDYFAVQNIFELNYPDLFDKNSALINIGARYTSINICSNGESLFNGDISMGGKNLTDTLMQEAGLTYEDAEKLKRKTDADNPELENVRESIKSAADDLSSELNKQLSLFWNATGLEGAIERIFISGGASQLPGLQKQLGEKTGLQCELLNPFLQVECGDIFDDEYLKNISPFVSIALGMGLRQPGDRNE